MGACEGRSALSRDDPQVTGTGRPREARRRPVSRGRVTRRRGRNPSADRARRVRRSRCWFDGRIGRGHECASEVEQHRAQVSAISYEIDGSAARREQKSERSHVALGRITAGTGENEIVAPVVRGETAAGRDMVERHDRSGEADSAVGADRAMLREQPGTGFHIGRSAGRMRRQLGDGLGGTTFSASPTPRLARPWRRGGWFMRRSCGRYAEPAAFAPSVLLSAVPFALVDRTRFGTERARSPARRGRVNREVRETKRVVCGC